MSDLLERVKSSQVCMGLIGTITLPAELHHALVAEVERLQNSNQRLLKHLSLWVAGANRGATIPKAMVMRLLKNELATQAAEAARKDGE